MNSLKYLMLLSLTACIAASSYDNEIDEMRSPCNIQDPLGCLQMKAWNFISSFFNKDTFNLSNFIKINRNSYGVQHARSNEDVEDKIERFIKTHNVQISLPMINTNVEMDTKNLDDGEVDLKVSFTEAAEGRKKSKIKKILLPIVMFVLLKAIILVPLALGITGLKVWNGLQLSFVSFVTAVVMAVYQLCRKLAADEAVPVAAHVAWDGPYRQKRSVNYEAHKLAYNGYR